jgi:threonine/homoserine/homoserine lactone efflux protein
MIDSGVWVFATAYFVSVASAGPGIAALVSRAVAYGWHGTPSFIFGFVAGDLVWLTVAVTGVSAVAQRASGLMIVLKYAGAGYLLYLAYRMWMARTPVQGEAPAARSRRPFMASLALTLGNPKPMMFFLAVLPTTVDLTRLSVVDLLAMIAIIPIVLAVVMIAYVAVAVRARSLFSHGRAFRILNRCGAVVMIGAALAVVTI